jgi:hypothetical protein
MFKSSKRFQSFALRVSFLLLLVTVGGSVSPLTVAFAQLEDPNIVSGGYTNQAIVDAVKKGHTSGPDPDACTFSGGIWEKAVGALACVAYGIFKFSSWLAMLAALMLNTIYDYLIVGMANIVRPFGDDSYSAIEEVWKVIRDLTNVFLVFLTVFIGIATIVGISGYGYKQLLWKVILAAIFVNFSITLAYFVIDIGNYTAITIYGALLEVSGTPNAGACVSQLGSIDVRDGNNACRTHGVAGAFINLFSMSSFYDVGLNDVGGGSTVEKRWRLFFAFLLAGSFMLVLAFVFAAGAFLIIGRFVILMFVILASPIGLVLWITGVSGIGRRWWHTLINQTLIAPLLLLFWFITFVLMRGFINAMALARSDGMGMEAGKLAQFESAATLTYIMMFVVGIGFLIASLVAAKSLGAYGATGAINLGKSMSRKSAMFVGGVAGAATVGAAAYGMRRGAGAVADKAESSAALKKMAGSTNLLAKTFAKTARATTQKVKSSSFDARALTGKAGQQWMGQSQKGGYTQWKKDKIKQEQEMAKWVAEPAPSSEDKRQRDQAIKQVNKDFAKYEDGSSIHTELGRVRLEVDKEYDAAMAIVNDTKKSKREKDLAQEKADKLIERGTELDVMDKNIGKQYTLKQEHLALEKEVSTGKTMENGKLVEMTEAEKKQKETDLKNKKAELDAATKEIEKSYGLVDNNVAKLNTELEELEGQKAGMKPDSKEAKAIDEWINKKKDERKAIINFHEASRDVSWFGDSEMLTKEQRTTMQQTMQGARVGVTQVQGNRGAQVDTVYKKRMEDAGKARKEAYVNQVSTQRGFAGLPTPDWRRELGTTLREPDAKAKKLAAIEDFLKEYEADEAKGSTGTSTTGTGTTPPHPTTP